MTGHAVIIERGALTVIHCPDRPDVSFFQKQLRGYMEVARRVALTDRRQLVVLCNEDGRMLNMPQTAYHPHCGLLVGPVLIVAQDFVNGEPDLVPLTLAEATAVLAEPPVTLIP